jgi:dTDP-4-amino-4,6-dideoxygalactose transaminase
MNYNIPLYDLNFDHNEEEAIIETLRSKWISTGPKSILFENKFSNLLNVKHSVALSNCTVALHLALKILEISKDDEVICPSLTFVATINSIMYVDAKPVFADVISYENPTIDPLDIERKITIKTKAIIVMHYAGFPCNMDSIKKIALRHNLKIIEDACHAPLSEYNGEKVGTIGDIGCFSFFSNKNISTGEGGMLVTNNTDYASKASLLRSHGMTTMSYQRALGHSTSYDVVDLGYNYRMDDIHASIGLIQLDKLKNDLEIRAILRAQYIKELTHFDEIIIPFKSHHEYSSNYIFPIVLKNSNFQKRDYIRSYLDKNGIQTSVHYQAVHKFSIYQSFYFNLPNTEYLSDNLITLPMHSKLTVNNILFIVSILKESLSSHK